MWSENGVFHRNQEWTWHRHVTLSYFVRKWNFPLQTQRLFSRQLILRVLWRLNFASNIFELFQTVKWPLWLSQNYHTKSFLSQNRTHDNPASFAMKSAINDGIDIQRRDISSRRKEVDPFIRKKPWRPDAFPQPSATDTGIPSSSEVSSPTFTSAVLFRFNWNPLYKSFQSF